MLTIITRMLSISRLKLLSLATCSTCMALYKHGPVVAICLSVGSALYKGTPTKLWSYQISFTSVPAASKSIGLLIDL